MRLDPARYSVADAGEFLRGQVGLRGYPPEHGDKNAHFVEVAQLIDWVKHAPFLASVHESVGKVIETHVDPWFCA